MKTAYVGWEAGSLYNNEIRVVSDPLAGLTLRGYQIDLGARQNSSPPLWGGQSPIADILFQGAFIAPPLPSGYPGSGSAVFNLHAAQIGGTNSAGIGATPPPATDGVFATAIIKMWVPQAVNKSLIMSDLSIAVPAGYYLTFFAGHSGFPADCEMQAVLYYD